MNEDKELARRIIHDSGIFMTERSHKAVNSMICVAMALARNKALEEAAKVAENEIDGRARQRVAYAIRRLKSVSLITGTEGDDMLRKTVKEYGALSDDQIRALKGEPK